MAMAAATQCLSRSGHYCVCRRPGAGNTKYQLVSSLCQPDPESHPVVADHPSVLGLDFTGRRIHVLIGYPSTFFGDLGRIRS